MMLGSSHGSFSCKQIEEYDTNKLFLADCEFQDECKEGK